MLGGIARGVGILQLAKIILLFFIHLAHWSFQNSPGTDKNSIATSLNLEAVPVHSARVKTSSSTLLSAVFIFALPAAQTPMVLVRTVQNMYNYVHNVIPFSHMCSDQRFQM